MHLPLSIPKEEKSKEEAFTFILSRIKAAIHCYEMRRRPVERLVIRFPLLGFNLYALVFDKYSEVRTLTID